MDGALRAALLAQPELGVAVCGPDGVLVAVNTALESTLGRLYERTGPLARAVRGERVVDAVISVRPPDAPIRFLRCHATRLHEPDGAVAGAVVFVADATAEISRRRELDALREKLVEKVNHELRTPSRERWTDWRPRWIASAT